MQDMNCLCWFDFFVNINVKRHYNKVPVIFSIGVTSNIKGLNNRAGWFTFRIVWNYFIVSAIHNNSCSVVLYLVLSGVNLCE